MNSICHLVNNKTVGAFIGESMALFPADKFWIMQKHVNTTLKKSVVFFHLIMIIHVMFIYFCH